MEEKENKRRIFKENFVGRWTELRMGKILKNLVLSFLVIYTLYNNFDWCLPNIQIIETAFFFIDFTKCSQLFLTGHFHSAIIKTMIFQKAHFQTALPNSPTSQTKFLPAQFPLKQKQNLNFKDKVWSQCCTRHKVQFFLQ